jgi:hypothetical protein
MPKAKSSVVSPQTADIQTMKSLQASLSATLDGIDLGPFQEDNQDAFQALTSQIAVSLSPVTMEDNHTHWSIPGVIEVVQDSETFFREAKLGIYLFLAIQAGVVEMILPSLQSVDVWIWRRRWHFVVV